jgi:hypothetical protein
LHKRQIDGDAGRMRRMRSDIAESEQPALVELGVEAPGGGVAGILCPVFHGGDGAGRAVAVVDLQAQAARRQISLDAGKRGRHVAAQHAFCDVVAGQGSAVDIVVAGIAHVLLDAGVDIAQIDKARRQPIARCRGQGEQ